MIWANPMPWATHGIHEPGKDPRCCVAGPGSQDRSPLHGAAWLLVSGPWLPWATHGMVQTINRQSMSKVTGNVIGHMCI